MKKQQQQNGKHGQVFHVEPLNIATQNLHHQTSVDTASTSKFRSVVQREPLKTAHGSSGQTRDQLYETVNAHATKTPQHHHGKTSKASKYQQNSLLRHVASVDKISSNNMDPAMLMEPVGESAIVSLNSDSNAFYYDDPPPHHASHYHAAKASEVKRRRADLSESHM